jgi:hypothetical protein
MQVTAQDMINDRCEWASSANSRTCNLVFHGYHTPCVKRLHLHAPPRNLAWLYAHPLRSMELRTINVAILPITP